MGITWTKDKVSSNGFKMIVGEGVNVRLKNRVSW